MPSLEDRIHEEALGHFQGLLRIDTTNPPGNEIEAVRYLADVLAGEGIEPRVFEPAPGRASLVARLPARRPADRGPLLLTSHVDVVAAEAERWKHPPFSGVVADGCVWGRGAVDMKSMTAYGLMAFLLARREEWPLTRDLVLAAVADEEAGGRWGMGWLVDHEPDAIRAEYALNEVGGFSLELGRRRVYPIQVAEKGICWIRLAAEGDPGHGSVPRPGSSVARVARAVDRLARAPLPAKVTPPAARYIAALAAAAGFPRGLVLQGLTVPGLGRLCRRLLPASRRPFFQAMLANTANPTGLAAGEKTNVVPSRATATIDGRLLPGETAEGFLEQIRRRIGPGYEIEVLDHLAPSESDPDTPLFELIREVLEAADPGARVVPSLVVGFTDAAHLSRLGVKTYGYAPMRLPPDLDFGALFHGHDERLPVESFRFGLEAFVEVVQRFSTG